MLTLDVTYKVKPKTIKNILKGKNNDKILGRIGGAVRKTARRSIRSRQGKNVNKPSKKGTPPHTRGRRLLKESITYDIERTFDQVVVGPSFDFVSDVGRAHEFGGKYKGNNYPKRPFMKPALTKILPTIPSKYRNIL